MRRIPRPQRAIDPSLPISPLIQRRTLPPSCLHAAAPHSHLRTTSACFSTTPTLNFLFGGKPDKKKQLATIRRWQKRILGDSEPIGSHVDPFDASSPVRIAPEEQGEEEEVLEEDKGAKNGRKKRGRGYEEAKQGPLLRVGGRQWIARAEEIEMAKEFEKLTLRTYTPMTQDMADQIEEWTGSFYTLQDENLAMAQAFDEATGKPYTPLSFGRHERIIDTQALRDNFHQAVVEMYALRQAKGKLDLSNTENRGIYDVPEWIKEVTLERDVQGELALAFPNGQSLESLLSEIRRMPTLRIVETPAPADNLLAEEGAPLGSGATGLPPPPPPPPTMDPATPAFKRAALVKDDAEKPKFDFFSNRPTPRKPKTVELVEPTKAAVEEAKPAEPIDPVEPVKAIVEEAELEAVAPKFDFNAAFETSSATLNELRRSVLESAARSSEQHVSAVRKALRDSITSSASTTVLHVEKPDSASRWHNVPLSDPELKFYLAKRIAQLTGHYIPDPKLTSTETLGDLYRHVCSVAHPTPTDVFTNVRKQLAGLAIKQKNAARVKATTKDLKPVKMLNVELLNRKETKTQRRVKIGMQKAVIRELQKQKLIAAPGGMTEEFKEEHMKMVSKADRLKNLSRVYPEFSHRGNKWAPKRTNA